MLPSTQLDNNLAIHPSHLLELANELMICICQHLSADDLVSIARSCHRLHRIALEVFFTRYKVNPMSSCISLGVSNQSIDALPGLAISLSTINRSISYISCDLTTRYESPSAMISETCDLKRFLSRFSAVSVVALNLLNPLVPPWEKCIIDLLDTIMLRGCTTLAITNFQMSSYQNDPLIQPRVLPHSRWLPHRLRKILSSTYAARRSSCPLQAFQIQVLPRFIQPYFSQLLNGSAITELSFRYIYNGDEWASFIWYIEMPRLTHLTIFQCSLPHAGLARFLRQHRTITHLDFQRNILPLNPTGLSAGLLPNLNTLRTMPEYLGVDLPPLASFPFLTVICLPLGDRHHEFSRVNRALECISHCTNDIILMLNIVLHKGLETWLASAGAGSAEASLASVKALELNTTIRSGLTACALARLPQWLALFPALNHVSVAAACLPPAAEGGPSAETLVQDIKMRCPRLSTVSLINKSEWCRSFPQRAPG